MVELVTYWKSLILWSSIQMSVSNGTLPAAVVKTEAPLLDGTLRAENGTIWLDSLCELEDNFESSSSSKKDKRQINYYLDGGVTIRSRIFKPGAWDCTGWIRNTPTHICIPKTVFCDGVDNCGLGQDEIGCQPPAAFNYLLNKGSDAADDNHNHEPTLIQRKEIEFVRSKDPYSDNTDDNDNNKMPQTTSHNSDDSDSLSSTSSHQNNNFINLNSSSTSSSSKTSTKSVSVIGGISFALTALCLALLIIACMMFVRRRRRQQANDKNWTGVAKPSDSELSDGSGKGNHPVITFGGDKPPQQLNYNNNSNNNTLRVPIPSSRFAFNNDNIVDTGGCQRNSSVKQQQYSSASTPPLLRQQQQQNGQHQKRKSTYEDPQYQQNSPILSERSRLLSIMMPNNNNNNNHSSSTYLSRSDYLLSPPTNGRNNSAANNGGGKMSAFLAYQSSSARNLFERFSTWGANNNNNTSIEASTDDSTASEERRIQDQSWIQL